MAWRLSASSVPTRVQRFDNILNAQAVSVFIVNRRTPEDRTDLQDTAFAFQVEMSVEADRPLVSRPDPHGLESEDWDERLADLHYRRCGRICGRS